MDFLVIFLAILLIVVTFYMIYTKYSSDNTQSKIEVDMSGQLADITSDKLVKPDAVSYTYKVWLYVDKPISSTGVIFERDKDLSLNLNGTTSVLSITTKHSSTADITHMITNNFPLQKWVYVVISVDNATIDMYLDGKLVKSVVDMHTPDGTSPIKFKINSGVFMSKFNRVVGASNPQTVWSDYLDGSGSAMGLSNLANKYSVNLAILKDNVLSTSVSLW
jgi:hypothetical protein